MVIEALKYSVTVNIAHEKGLVGKKSITLPTTWITKKMRHKSIF